MSPSATPRRPGRAPAHQEPASPSPEEVAAILSAVADLLSKEEEAGAAPPEPVDRWAAAGRGGRAKGGPGGRPRRPAAGEGR